MSAEPQHLSAAIIL